MVNNKTMKVKKGKFFDYYRGDGYYIAFKNLTFAVRFKWYFDFVRPPVKPGYWRLYIGPFEIEYRPFYL